MNIVEKIKMMMEEKDITRAELAKGADIPYTTIDGIIKRNNESIRFPALKKLAIFFDVSMEYLITDEIEDRNYGKIITSELTLEEHRLISLWRNLPHDERMKMLGRIEAKLEEE